MHEVLILGTGIVIGTISTGVAVYLGGYLVLRTYMDLTQPHIELPNTIVDNKENTTTTQPDGYDWNEYDNYLTPPLGDDGEEPEA